MDHPHGGTSSSGGINRDVSVSRVGGALGCLLPITLAILALFSITHEGSKIIKREGSGLHLRPYSKK